MHAETHPDGLNPEGTGKDFVVKLDGTGLTFAPPGEKPVVLPGSRVIPVFQITADPGDLASLELPGQTPVRAVGDNIVREVFAFAGANLLQLTNFRRVDTFARLLSVDHRRAFFTASADPFGTNPFENCQLFSIDTLGTDLRQLTRFGAGESSVVDGCQVGTRQIPPPACGVLFLLGQDPKTQTLVFVSNCDPLGKNPYGTQIFAMHPDGTGLRQLTDTRGFVTEADSTVTMESPGLFDYGPHS